MSNVMIWGGTRGLGRELARASLSRGHSTTVTGRSQPSDLESSIEFARADFQQGSMEYGFTVASVDADILFWVAGSWLRKPLPECTPEELLNLYQVHLITPTTWLANILLLRGRQHKPQLHLVTVASSSARKIRSDGQAAYGAVQAGKVQFARNLHAEAPELVGRSTIVRPGGMKTDFFQGSDVDTSRFADPIEVAEMIWRFVEGSRPPMLELDISQEDGMLNVRTFDRDGDIWPWTSDIISPQSR